MKRTEEEMVEHYKCKLLNVTATVRLLEYKEE
jgi:hypothetical protein